MKKILFFAVIATAVFTSCSNEDGLETVQKSSADNAINFSAYTGSAVSTRGAVVAKDSIQKTGIGVFAFYQPASNGVAGPNFTTIKYPTPDFMYNQEVTAIDASGIVTWSYSPIKYWPNNTGDKLTFFAYAPYKSDKAWEDLNVTTDATGNKVSSTFTINNGVDDQVDYLWAEPVKNMGKPDGGNYMNSKVEFSFSHVTSKVNLYIGVQTPDNITAATSSSGNAWTDSTTTIEIKSIQFKNLAQNFTWSKEGSKDATYVAEGSQNITATPYEIADSFVVVTGKILPGVQYYQRTENNGKFEYTTKAKFAENKVYYTDSENAYKQDAANAEYDITKTYYNISASQTTDTEVKEEKTYYTKSPESEIVYTKVDNPSKDQISTYYELTVAKHPIEVSDLKEPYKKGVNYGYVTADTWAAGWHRFLQCKDNNNIKASSNDPTIGTTADDQYMFVAPQKFTDDQTVVITYTVTTKDGTNSLGLNNSPITNTITKKMSDFSLTDNEFKIGTQYNLFFLIGLQTVKVAATANDWTGTASDGYVDIPAANAFGDE